MGRGGFGSNGRRPGSVVVAAGGAAAAPSAAPCRRTACAPVGGLVLATSAQKGSEVLAVQPLQNSLMSATLAASTEVLALMGTMTPAAPSLPCHCRRQGRPPRHRPPHGPWSAPAGALLLIRHCNADGRAPLQPRGLHWRHARRVGCSSVRGCIGARDVRAAGFPQGIGLRQPVRTVPVAAAILLPPLAAFGRLWPVLALLVAGTFL